MFKFLQKNNNKAGDEGIATDAMDITDEASFVYVPYEKNETSSSLSLKPLHDRIGVDWGKISARKMATEFYATISAQAIQEDDSKRAPVDFVYVSYENNETSSSLSLKIKPLHDTIGVSAEKKTTEFCATISAQAIPEDDSKRAPVDIVVALDTSGSMEGSKLSLCKTTLNILLRELRSSDRFGLVVFGSEAEVIIPPKELTKENRDYAIEKIKNIHTLGMTNMSGGIGLAAKEIKSIKSPNKVRAVFLLTDGQANVGIKYKEEMVNLTKGCLGSCEQNPVPIHCFGYGIDHDREMLRDISMVTPGGTYYFVGNDDDVSSAFGDALGGVLSVVAQNAVLTLKIHTEAANNGAKIVSVKHDDAIEKADGSYNVSLKDFYAEESRDVILHVTLSDICSNDPVSQITASMQYLDTINSKLVESDEVIGSIKRPEGDVISAETDQYVLLQCIRVETTDVISESQALADRGQIAMAKQKINDHIKYLQNQKSAKESPFLDQLLSELYTIESGLTSQVVYNTTGSFAMQTYWMAHKTQRCAMSSDQSDNMYRSPTKRTLATRMKILAQAQGSVDSGRLK